jgi:hypothetical protein
MTGISRNQPAAGSFETRSLSTLIRCIVVSNTLQKCHLAQRFACQFDAVANRSPSQSSRRRSCRRSMGLVSRILSDRCQIANAHLRTVGQRCVSYCRPVKDGAACLGTIQATAPVSRKFSLKSRRRPLLPPFFVRAFYHGNIVQLNSLDEDSKSSPLKALLQRSPVSLLITTHVSTYSGPKRRPDTFAQRAKRSHQRC